MIFIVTEQIMNGTVTMDIRVSGIEEKNFILARAKLIRQLVKNAPNHVVTESNDKIFTYTANAELPNYGTMRNEPLEIL